MLTVKSVDQARKYYSGQRKKVKTICTNCFTTVTVDPKDGEAFCPKCLNGFRMVKI